jgi:DNA-binding MarR family transcriptional regulator
MARWAGRPDVRVALLGRAGRELSGNDVHLLRTVVARGPVRASDLAAWQGVDKSTISTQVRRLEERGLVARRPDPADRRAVLFTATARGRKLRRRMDTAGAALFGELLRDWPEEDRLALATLLDRFSRRLDNEPAAHPTPATGSG